MYSKFNAYSLNSTLLKAVMAGVLIVLVSGCGTLPSRDKKQLAEGVPGTAASTENVSENAHMSYQMDDGGLVLELSPSGGFVSAEVTATARVLNDTSAGREAALSVATVRAKRILAEFLENRIRSSVVIDSLAKATNKENSYAQEVSDKISSNSQALIKGAYVSGQEMGEDTATVRLKVTTLSIRGSQSLRNMMGGGE